jgi:hypothetical protein
MARYSKIERCIAADAKFNQLTDNAQLVFFTLLTHPHLTTLGAMRANVPGLAHERKWGKKKYHKVLEELVQQGMVKYDDSASLVWLPNYLKHNHPESPNVVKSWAKSLDCLSECALRNEIIQHTKAFIENFSKEFRDVLPAVFLTEVPLQQAAPLVEAPTPPVEKEEKALIVAPATLTSPHAVEHVFQHWQNVFDHPQAVLDEKRKRLIRQALKSGYTEDQLCEAITGCSYTPHNMGDNDKGQRYDGLHVILRDADQIDRFIHNAHNPPKPMNEADKLLYANIQAGQSWLRYHAEREAS